MRRCVADLLVLSMAGYLTISTPYRAPCLMSLAGLSLSNTDRKITCFVDAKVILRFSLMRLEAEDRLFNRHSAPSAEFPEITSVLRSLKTWQYEMRVAARLPAVRKTRVATPRGNFGSEIRLPSGVLLRLIFLP